MESTKKMERKSLVAVIGMGILAGSSWIAQSASAAPLLYNVVVSESNVFVRTDVGASMDVSPDFTEGLPGGDEFPMAASMTGSSNTFPTPQSRVTADVGLPGGFDGANGISFTELSIKTTNTPGTLTGFGSVPVPLDATGLSVQLVAFSARVSVFQILLDAPFSSSLTPTGNPDEWLWAGLADVRLVGILEPIVSIPGQDPVTLGAFPFDQAMTMPLAGTFSAIPTGTEITVGIPLDTLQDQDLTLPEINVPFDITGLGLVTGFFQLENLVLADIATEVVYRNATPIPEPGTALLLGLGLVGLAVVRRR